MSFWLNPQGDKTGTINVEGMCSCGEVLFIKSGDPLPSYNEDAIVCIFDTSKVYIPYKGKWEVLQ